MIKWLKNLFKKKEQNPYEYYLIIHRETNWRYNVRDEKGRFTKRKGKENG